MNSAIKFSFVAIDLSDNASIRKGAKEVQDLAPKVDVLINSAGIMGLETYQKSKDGVELQLAACHIGHFLLTGLLIPQLEASGDARVITLTSTGYESSDFRYDDWNFSDGKTYDAWASYGQAKTANILFTRELAKRAKEQSKPITALVLHPGVVLASGIMQNTNMDALMEALEKSKKKAADEGKEFDQEAPKSIQQGCATVVVAAMQPDLKQALWGIFERL